MIGKQRPTTIGVIYYYITTYLNYRIIIWVLYKLRNFSTIGTYIYYTNNNNDNKLNTSTSQVSDLDPVVGNVRG